jgi:hypothetical protein
MGFLLLSVASCSMAVAGGKFHVTKQLHKSLKLARDLNMHSELDVNKNKREIYYQLQYLRSDEENNVFIKNEISVVLIYMKMALFWVVAPCSL